MPKKIAFLLIALIAVLMYPNEADARNNFKKSKVTCNITGEVLQLECYKTNDGTPYLTATEENISNLCMLMGGVASRSQISNEMFISKDNNNLLLNPKENNANDNDPIILYEQRRRDKCTLIKLEFLTEYLKSKLVYDKQADVYYIYPVISRISIEENSDGANIIFNASFNVKYSSTNLHDPERVAILIEDAYIDSTIKIPDNPILKGLMLEQVDTKNVKITFPTSEDKKVLIQPRILPQSVVVKIKTNTSNVAKTQSGDIQITNLNIEDTENGVNVIIESTAPLSYRWNRLRPPDNRFFIDFGNTILSAPYTTFEPRNPLVTKIRAAQLQPGPDGVTRIVLDMTQPAQCEVMVNKNDPKQMLLVIKNRLIDTDSAQLCGIGSANPNMDSEDEVYGQVYGQGYNRVYGGESLGQIICIDPGHGGSDRGAFNHRFGLAEKDITLDISLRLAEILKSRGCKIVMTRTSDRDVTYAGSPDREELGARTSIADYSSANLFISVHINASVNKQANGISTHWYKFQDKNLASEIQYQLVSKTGRRDRGIQRDRFFVLRNTDIPSVLVEAGFISNDEEASLLTNEEYIQRIAEGIADGLGIYVCKATNRSTSGRRTASYKK